jgi:hypothetical protein
MKKILLILVIIAFFGCKDDDESGLKGVPLNDDRFNGTYIYYYKTIARDEINEHYEEITMDFDGTTVAFFRNPYRKYNTSTGWSIGTDYYDLEFEIKDGLYKVSRRGQNNFSDWQPFEFLNNNNTLIFRNFKIFNDKDLILRKEAPNEKGKYKINYAYVGQLYGGYSTGLGEFVASTAKAYISMIDNKPATRWNTSQYFTGDYYYGNEFIYYNGSDINLYAADNTPPPSPTITITYQPFNSSRYGMSAENIIINDVIRGTKLSKPNDPIKEGYIFNGWYHKGDIVDFNQFVVVENTYIVADWIYDYEVSNINFTDSGNADNIQRNIYWDYPTDNLFERIILYTETGIQLSPQWKINNMECIVFPSRRTDISNYIKIVCVSIDNYKSNGRIFYWNK